MKYTRNLATAALALATATTFAGGVQAASLQLANISASWLNPVDGANVITAGNGTDTPSINWGITDGDQSGYLLEVLDDPVPQPAAEVDEVFDVADFTHINNPVSLGTSISQVELEITADVLLDGATEVAGAAFNFLFNHDETMNDPSECPDEPEASACADIVTTSLLNDKSSFAADGQIFTLSILGFLNGDGELTEEFISPERSTNTGTIQAEFTATVPLPAGGLLLLTALGGMAAVRSRRKAA